MKILDISQPLHSKMAVWPGDTEFSFQLTWTKEQSGSVNVGQIQLSTHTGTHIDAPFHFDEQGQKVHQLDLLLYVGQCRVIHLSEARVICVEDLQKYDLSGVLRLLIHTDFWKDRAQFPTDIPCLTPKAVTYLSEQGIKLIGLDLPSVDPIDSKELEIHHIMNSYGIHILEGLVLDHVEEGEYELIALPLSIHNGDGSPVRAVLRTIN
ncbi:arylformamidase [Risungbinella massiliensis]|uniref:arylformamidase n=1 Tax=Risungbinella massiliensis TaxID=1329796 RepID=UPI0005CBEC46|nr:arylformamidase [Risungbinella massiliensis]